MTSIAPIIGNVYIELNEFLDEGLHDENWSFNPHNPQA